MSGGFFRGTSADQDTRFSNKQAKLMKSQKFPSELEHLVDITKVKMDVMKPWIAQRATELLGFEDEVLINFIYGLLDGKAVNGKEVQISLTGFMEKNTGKFMKELWQLLLSAQNNASGVPQQLLDAKEEETRKKQAESDKIKSEMQKKKEKEGKEIEEEKMKKSDGDAGLNRTDTATLELSSKRHPEASYDKEIDARNGTRRRNRASNSPQSPGGVSMSPRNRRSRSMSKSFSNSRSYSEERHKSRNLSRSPMSRGRSISSERVHHSRRRRSITTRRKHSPPLSISPPIRRSFHSRRRSTSRSRRTSPSPIRRRRPSPETYMSRSPIRRRSQTPVRRRPRSPPRYRSRSPVRRRYQSPRRRSPSPFRRPYRRSPSTPPPRSPSPVRRRSPIRNRKRLLTPPRHRSRSQEGLGSPSPARRLSPSPVKKKSPKRQRSPLRSPRERTRAFEKSSSVRRARQRGSSGDSDELREGPGSPVQQPSVSLRSPQRDATVLGNSHKKASSSSPSPQKSQIHSKSPANSRRRSPTEDRSPYKGHVVQSKERVQDVRESPPQNTRNRKPRPASPVPIAKKGKFDNARNDGNQNLKTSERPDTSSKSDTQKDIARVDRKHDYSPERSVGHQASETRIRSDGVELRKKELENRSEKTSTKVLHPEDIDKERVPAFHEDFQKADEKIQPLSSKAKHIKRFHETDKSNVKVDETVGSGSLSSGSDDSLKRHNRKGHDYRKHRRSGKKEVTSDDSSDSEIEDRKVAKRRKKEEKRSRKEERRRRREERHRRREERRSDKLKAKSNDGSSAEETFRDQKKLEIELREKALESLRARKGTGR